jgi:hypothetical protein
MDFHTDRTIKAVVETEYTSLYKWSLQEFDKDGKKVGRSQVPWEWSLDFAATEFSLSEELELKAKLPPRKSLDPVRETDADLKIVTKERSHIEAKLRPGYAADPDSGARFSMLGTARTIKYFALEIYQLDSEEEEETCHAWGCLSYTAKIDFSHETTDDALLFHLEVKPSRYAQFVQMLRERPPNHAILRVGSVSGFYSAWSEAVQTASVKVLTNDDKHVVELPENFEGKAPRLGMIGRFDLTFITKHETERPPRIADDEDAEALAVAQGSATDDTEALQRAQLKVSLELQKKIKELTYAAWVIAVILVILAFRR